MFVGALVCATVAFMNIPGTKTEVDFGRDHGWPFVYLHRVAPVPSKPPAIVCYIYSFPAIWSLTEDVEQFRPLLLLANLGVLIVLGLLTAAAWEWWRRRHGSFWQFSLRTTILVTIASSIFFGWIGHRVARWHSQRAAMVQLESAGARIQYDLLLPEWLRELLNDDIGRPFDNVWSVDLSYTGAPDDALPPLVLLPELESLDLSSTQITDAGLRHIAHLQNLDWLSLDDTAVTDEGLVHLQHLHRLKCLGLDETNIAGAGLRHLTGLHTLEIMGICDTPLTDDGLRHLAGLPKLGIVYTRGTKITESGATQFEAQSVNHVMVDYDWGAEYETDTDNPFALENPFR
jgi:hypothetical protein